MLLGHPAGMEKELGTHSEAESVSQIMLKPFYLIMLVGVVIGGVFFASALFL